VGGKVWRLNFWLFFAEFKFLFKGANGVLIILFANFTKKDCIHIKSTSNIPKALLHACTI
jgi:hypothetical protein